MEYGCELWDGCSVADQNRLESVQLEAARIACGLPTFCSKEAVYFESGLEPLVDRRQRRKLILFYKIQTQMVPSYLVDLCPPRVRDTTTRDLRNLDQFVNPRSRLAIYSRSFFPSSTLLWNNLRHDQQNMPTLNSFKTSISVDVNSCPDFFQTGERKLNILHTRLRHQCSVLNYDLFRCNLVPDPSCRCGCPCENSYHYFFECILYIGAREMLYATLRHLCPVTLSILLSGSSDLSASGNKIVFDAVYRYIRDSKRF